MQKLFSFSKNQAGVLITLVILIALGACYFFMYLPNNERTVQERRFRCLRKIDRGLRQKIGTSEKQITSLINDYYKYSNNRQDKDLEKLKRYIAQYSRKNFTLLLPEQANKYANAGHIAYIGNDTSGNRFYIDADSRITLFVNKPADGKAPDSAGAKVNLSGTTIGIQFEYDQFIKPLLLRDVFSYYLVFINKHKVYEDYPTGLNDNEPDSLLNKKSQITTPGVHSLQIGETDYKVFSHPVYTYDNDKWIITGLLKNADYQQEKNQLPLWVLLLLMTILVTMLVSLPWIKLYHMGNKDRLTINDAIASVLVSIVLMSLLFFVFFKYCIDIKQDLLPYPYSKTKGYVSYPSDTYSRNVLASKVNGAFTGEVNVAYNLLDSFKMNRTLVDTDVRLLRKSKSKYGALLRKYAPDLDIKEVYWLDGNATELTNLTVDSNNDPKGNYKNRSYFNEAGKYTVGNHKFYLDQIYSYTNGTYRSVISMSAKKIGKDSVVAMSLNLKSFDKVAMPDGYQFAIISKAGWVLYHSITNRNLLDNLQQEFVDDKDLLSSIEANSDTSFKAEYYGKPYYVKIKPVPGLPYYTIIFEDLEYNDIRDTEAYTFTVCMLTGMLIFLSIKYLIVFLVSSRHSSFKKQRFDTSWVGPHVSAHHQYNLAIIANLFVILMLIIFFNFCSFLAYLYLVLVSVLLTSIFLNGFFAEKYKNTDQYKYKFKVKTIAWLSAIILLIDISAFFSLTGTHCFFLVLYEVILIAIFPVLSILSGRSLVKLHQFKAKHRITWTFARSYALMATTRLVISSGIPAAFFFIYSFNYEQNLDTRYRQLNFAGSLLNKTSINSKNLQATNRKLDSIKNNQIYTSGIYLDGFFIDWVRIDSGKKLADSIKRISRYTNEDLLTAQILNAFRLQTDNIEVQNNNLNLSSAGNSVFFTKLNKQSGDKSPVQTFYKIDTASYLKVSSLSHVNYETPDVLFWILLITSVLLFYFVVHQVTRKLFSLNMLPTKNWGEMDSELLENNEFNNMALLVGSPGANTLQKLTDKINRQKILSADGNSLLINNAGQLKYNVFIADMMIISAENGETDPDWKRHKKAILAGHGLVIINHFEYNIKDSGVNKIKLDLLESLIEQKTSKVIIISTMHPLIFLDSFNGEQPDPAFESEMSRWYVLLGNFHVLIDPLIGSRVPKNVQILKRAVTEETRYSRFLHAMQKVFLKYLDRGINAGSLNEEVKEQLTDSIIFKLQLTSQYFYTDIWQSLTHEEKFLLYDLAEDGFVNSFDDFNLSMLMCKGLIINNDGALILFNRGFRNFILTAIGEKEMERIKEQVKDNGKWGNLKMPLNLAIVAILAFLFASQQESYSKVITYITAFSAGIPAVLKIFSLFGTSTPQKSG